MLNTNDIKKLEEYFIKYDELKSKRELRKHTLLTKEVDENIGTKSTALPKSQVENQVIKLHSDLIYQNIDRIINAIEYIYGNCTDVQRVIIECRYWHEVDTAYEWEDIAHHLTTLRTDGKVISKNATLHARNKMLNNFALKIGWIV
ncbi:transcriptional regulator [Macrococcus armenti]|uniref:transcriptional regulator n=1 Tax=Macrococcus armenti TaxID=2875764 RepID=UPI001CCE1C3B|nr:transcriptional regulator [Macrococcus armenti]UBH07854.1 transcriptional regulator [Macrococcus armenti]